MIFVREMRYIFRHRTTMFITVLGPVLSFILICLIFQQGVPDSLPVAVVDNDHSAFSRTLNRMVAATAIAETDRSYLNLNDAQKALEAGTVDAVIYIPAKTEQNIINGKQVDIPLYLNNTNVVKSGLLNSGIQKALATLSAGVKLKFHIAGGKTYQQALENSIPVSVHSTALFNPYLNYTYFLASALLPVLLIMFTLLATVYSIGRELRHGSGRSFIRMSGDSVLVGLFAKLTPYTFIYICMALLMNILLFNHIGMPMRGNIWVLILSETVLIISYQFLAIFFLALFKNMRLVLSVVSAYAMMALTFSGLTFPVFGMPSGAQVFAQLFPFTHWLKVFIGQAMRNESLEHSFSAMQICMVFIIIGALCIPRLKYILITPKFWGKQ